MPSLVPLVVAHGTPIVFAATLAARIGAPVPAAPFLVVAGGLAVGGQISWVAVLAAAIVANLIGDGLWFWAGRRHGYRVLKLLCRISISPDSCVSQSEAFILRWGGSSLIAAKFVPGVSVVAPPMAGALGMSVAAFVGFETLAGAIWAALFLGLGWVFADQIQRVMDLLSTLGIAAAVVLAVLAAGYLALRYWRRRVFLADVAMARIGIDELRALIDRGHAPLIIVDVRSEAARTIDTRRIPGAIGVALDEIEQQAAAWPVDAELVLYCNCPNEASAASAAVKLAARGFTRVRPLAGGLDAWVASGHAIEAHTPVAPPALTPPAHAATMGG
ncbi:MAG TPA: VTT domain-containing protein [Burkholderiaceae bacterium]|nr:VTT domain-containing protein [Burkholderiaceae bacterium]